MKADSFRVHTLSKVRHKLQPALMEAARQLTMIVDSHQLSFVDLPFLTEHITTNRCICTRTDTDTVVLGTNDI